MRGKRASGRAGYDTNARKTGAVRGERDNRSGMLERSREGYDSRRSRNRPAAIALGRNLRGSRSRGIGRSNGDTISLNGVVLVRDVDDNVVGNTRTGDGERLLLGNSGRTRGEGVAIQRQNEPVPERTNVALVGRRAAGDVRTWTLRPSVMPIDEGTAISGSEGKSSPTSWGSR